MCDTVEKAAVPYNNTLRVPPGAVCTVTLMDAYGDGWSGNTWTADPWLGTGETLTMSHGSKSQMHTFTVPTGSSEGGGEGGMGTGTGTGTGTGEQRRRLGEGLFSDPVVTPEQCKPVLDEWLVIDTGSPQPILGLVTDRAKEQMPWGPMGTYCAKNNDNYYADLPDKNPPAINEAARVGQNIPACAYNKCEVPYSKGRCADECYKNPFCRYFFHVSTTGLCQLYSGADCPNA